jgi:GT2 family glycosyltransferase
MSVSTIIPAYKKTEMFANSLSNNLDHISDTQIIIINDDPTTDLQKSQIADIAPKSTVFLQNEKNLGFAKSVNKAFAICNTDFVLLLNTDVYMHDDSWHNAVRLMIENPNIFAIGFAQKNDHESKKLDGRNRLYFEQGLFHHSKVEVKSSEKENLTQHSQIVTTAWAEGGCSLFRKQIWDEINGFDENFSPFYWEDVDLSYRARKRGFGIFFCPHIVMTHRHESTIGSEYNRTEILQIAFSHQTYFTKKHANLWQKISFYFYATLRFAKKLIQA